MPRPPKQPEETPPSPARRKRSKAGPAEGLPPESARPPALPPPRLTGSRRTARAPAAAPAPPDDEEDDLGGDDDALGWRGALALLAAAVGVGLCLAAATLYADARREVAAWRASPIAAAPTLVWSAPLELHAGDPVDVAALIDDLRAAGYEQRGPIDTPGRFLLRPLGPTDGEAPSSWGLEVWTAAARAPGVDVPEQRATATIRDGRVTSVQPSTGLLLWPTLLGLVGDADRRREPVRLAELSPFVVPALLAIEDARFHDHPGVDPIGLVRAIVSNLLGRAVQGGSTLTQQLAKNLFLAQDRTLQRKVREAFLAAALEASFSKDELLELYLSEVYLGHTDGLPVHGVEAAARAWFGKSAAGVSAAEAATLAGTIASPNGWSPVRNPSAALTRRNVVIERMRYVRALTDAQADEALAEPLALTPNPVGVAWRLPWAVTAALSTAEDALGDAWGQGQGLEVFSATQPHLQRAVEGAALPALAKVLAAHPRAGGGEDVELAVAVVRASDGALVAALGGRDWSKSPFHRALDAWREAGSTVKPLTLLAAAARDPKLGPSTSLVDAPLRLRLDGPTWTPQNADGQFLGRVSVRQMLLQSRNIPAVHLAERVGWDDLQAALQQVGLTGATSLPSASLGAFPTHVVQLAAAYTPFVRGGSWVPARVVLGVQGPDEPDTPGRSLLEPAEPPIDVAPAAPTAWVRHLLEDVVTEGTGRGVAAAGLRGALGGKTGTTDQERDAWFVGFDDTYVAAVWVGTDRGTLGLSGAQAAVPVWVAVMRALGAPHGAWEDPEGLVSARICGPGDQPLCPGDSCAQPRAAWYPVGHVPPCKPAAADPTSDPHPQPEAAP